MVTFVIHYIDSLGTQNDITQNMVKVDFIIKKPYRSKYVAQEIIIMVMDGDDGYFSLMN